MRPAAATDNRPITRSAPQDMVADRDSGVTSCQALADQVPLSQMSTSQAPAVAAAAHSSMRVPRAARGIYAPAWPRPVPYRPA